MLALLQRSAAVFVLVGLGCGDNTALPPDAAPDAAPIAGQGSAPTGGLIITEVHARGEGPDWIELRNRGEDPIDLCDYFLTDSVDRLDHYLALGGAAPPDPCEPDLVAAGEFVIVFADDDAELGADHAPFRLGEADEVHLVDLSGRATDSLVYLLRDADGTLARIPTDTGLFFPAEPTPGEANPEEQP